MMSPSQRFKWSGQRKETREEKGERSKGFQVVEPISHVGTDGRGAAVCGQLRKDPVI